MIQLSKLRRDATNSEIQPILDLSNSIFGSETSAPIVSHHGSLEEWQNRLSSAESVIVYATVPTTENSNGAVPVGFVFAHPKRRSEEDADPALHIWLAGILPSQRGGRLFQKLMQAVELHAREKGIAILSVATFPSKFVKMYSILKKTGWEEVETFENGKVLLRKDLSKATITSN